MAINSFIQRSARGLTVAAAIVAGLSLVMPGPAEARVSNGAAVGIGLGAFALGTAAGAAATPYGYAPYGGYAPPPAYYAPPAPYYAPVRNCWDPYYQRYYAC